MMRIFYKTHEDEVWIYGKTWIIYDLEGKNIEFITEWMQLK